MCIRDRDYDQVEVFLLDDTTQEQAQNIMNEMEGYEGVSLSLIHI